MPSTSYTTGTPVTGHKFYNRTELLGDLGQFDGTSYILNGLRRIGKTSVLKQLEINLSSVLDVAPVYCSLDGHENAVEMGEELRREILNCIEKNNWNSDFHLNPDAPIDEVLEGWIAYCKKHKLRSFLLLDECEQLHFLEPKNIINLNNLFSRNTPILKVIIAGTRHFFQDTRESFVGFSEFFQKKYIGHFELPYVHDLVNQRLEKTQSLSVQESTIDKIIEYCGGHPYLVQLFCARLYRSDSEKLKEINESTFAIDPHLGNFFKIDYDSLTEIQQKILVYICNKGKVSRADIQQALKINDIKFRSAITEMLELGIVKNDPGTGHIFIAYAFFSDWILNIFDTLEPNLPAPKLKIVTLCATDAFTYLTELQKECLNVLHPYFEHWDQHQFSVGNLEELTLRKLEEADIILVLLSPMFFEQDSETERLFHIYKKHERFIPILATSFLHEEYVPPTEFNVLPKSEAVFKPLQEWNPKGAAYKQISQQLLAIKNEINNKRSK